MPYVLLTSPCGVFALPLRTRLSSQEMDSRPKEVTVDKRGKDWRRETEEVEEKGRESEDSLVLELLADWGRFHWAEGRCRKFSSVRKCQELGFD